MRSKHHLPLPVCSVGLSFPSVEVRFENLEVEAHVYLGTRALPTLLNFTLNMAVVSGPSLLVTHQGISCLEAATCPRNER